MSEDAAVSEPAALEDMRNTLEKIREKLVCAEAYAYLERNDAGMVRAYLCGMHVVTAPYATQYFKEEA